MVEEHAHHWHLNFYEPGIFKGECHCGATRFFADGLRDEWKKRAVELNKEAQVGDKQKTNCRPAVEEPAADPKAKGLHRIQVARAARANMCLKCKEAYEHDEKRWCRKKKCPSRVPRTMRLAFRPFADVPEPVKVTKKVTKQKGLEEKKEESLQELIENEINEYHRDMSKEGNQPTLSPSSRARYILTRIREQLYKCIR